MSLVNSGILIISTGQWCPSAVYRVEDSPEGMQFLTLHFCIADNIRNLFNVNPTLYSNNRKKGGCNINQSHMLGPGGT